jgi:CPA1 family monovalent cation:H+ antiporter
MGLMNTAAALITLAAFFSWLNHRLFRLPTTIALLLFSLATSAAIIALGKLGVPFDTGAAELLAAVDFDEALLQGMLSFLLFAGALHIDLSELAQRKWAIGFLASAGVLISTALVGVVTWWLFDLLGHGIPLIFCLLFGALISPTDPIAVLAILKSADAERSLRIKMAGESLLNDGVGVVVFLVLLGIASGGHASTPQGVALLFVQEVLGGALFGLAIGYAAYRMLASVDNYQVEILITLALVMGGYAHRHPPAPFWPDRDRRGGAAHRQPWPALCHVGEDHRAPRLVLGAYGRDPQRGAVRPHWTGSVADRL